MLIVVDVHRQQRQVIMFSDIIIKNKINETISSQKREISFFKNILMAFFMPLCCFYLQV